MAKPIKTLFDTVGVDRKNIEQWTDHYFGNTRRVAEANGDPVVTYAVFVRHPTVFAPDMAVGWMKAAAREGGYNIRIESPYEPGDIVPAGQPQLFLQGPMSKLTETETLFLQRVGAVGVAAYNAMQCVSELPDVAFFTAGARHCVGLEMVECMEYAAYMGSVAARKKHGNNLAGFVNSAVNATAHFFGKEKGGGTTPHAMYGLFDNFLDAVIAYRETCPDEPFIILPDYYGREVSHTLDVAKHFRSDAESGIMGARLDTHGGRYMEVLDHNSSIETIHRLAPHMMDQEWTEKQLKMLYGPGVSVANVLRFKEAMQEAGFPNIKVIGSSGFNPEKCRMMAMAEAPLDGVGTGSYIPKDFAATYATADIFDYAGRRSIKVGREYLGESYDNAKAENGLHIL